MGGNVKSMISMGRFPFPALSENHNTERLGFLHPTALARSSNPWFAWINWSTTVCSKAFFDTWYRREKPASNLFPQWDFLFAGFAFPLYLWQKPRYLWAHSSKLLRNCYKKRYKLHTQSDRTIFPFYPDSDRFFHKIWLKTLLLSHSWWSTIQWKYC